MQSAGIETARPSTYSRRWSAAAITAGLGALAATIAIAFLTGAGVDQLAKPDPRVSALVLGITFVAILRAGLTAFQRIAAFHASVNRKSELRRAIFAKLLDLGPCHTKSRPTGELVNECVEGVESLDSYYGLFVPQLVVGLAAPIAVCAALAMLDGILALVLLLAAPVPPLLLVLAKGRFRAVTVRYREAMARLSSQFLDAVLGLPTLKLLGRGRAQAERIRASSESFRRETMRLLAANQIVIFLMDWGFALSAVTVATIVGLLRWNAGALTLGGIFVAILLATEMIRQINLLASFFFAGAGGRAVLAKIDALLAIPPAVVSKANAKAPSPFLPAIRFENVCFRYESDPILDDLSFHIEPGETVGIIGPSGSGKSTLAHLLMRFNDPETGRILVSGHDVREVPLAWLREQIAIVPQDPHLFLGSIAENLRVARPQASDAELRQAARDAQLAAFIESLPRGYDTPIGERAARLSGGQAQRLAIARAFLRNAPILILDEATASLDAHNEAALRQVLSRLCAGRTTLVIAHRAGALRHADRILELRDGRLASATSPTPYALAT